MKENQCLKDQLIEEEKMRDDLDQYNRRKNLEFHGIPLIQMKILTISSKPWQKK